MRKISVFSKFHTKKTTVVLLFLIGFSNIFALTQDDVMFLVPDRLPLFGNMLLVDNFPDMINSNTISDYEVLNKKAQTIVNGFYKGVIKKTDIEPDGQLIILNSYQKAIEKIKKGSIDYQNSALMFTSPTTAFVSFVFFLPKGLYTKGNVYFDITSKAVALKGKKKKTTVDLLISDIQWNFSASEKVDVDFFPQEIDTN